MSELEKGDHQHVTLGRIAIARHDYDGEYVTVYETSGNGLWSATIHADDLAKLLVPLLDGYRNETDRRSYKNEREQFEAEFKIGPSKVAA